MHEKSLKMTIMMHHHAITLHQRLPMMERCLSFLGVFDHHCMEIQKGDILLGDADAPVDIGRIAVLLVVWRGDGEVGACIEGLMADEHTVAEGLPREVLRGRETTGMEEMAVFIDDVRVAVKHGGVIVPL